MTGFYDVSRGCMSLDDVRRRLVRAFERALGSLKELPEGRGLATMATVLIYGPPDAPMMKSDILPRLNYYHHRSSNAVEIFTIAYNERGGDNDPMPLFDDEGFANAIAELERATKWKYSGQTDMLFLASTLDMVRRPTGSILPSVRFVFEEVVCLCLERVVADKAISSGAGLIEEIIRASSHRSKGEFVSEVATALAAQNAKKGLINWVAGLLKLDAVALQNVGTVLANDLRPST